MARKSKISDEILTVPPLKPSDPEALIVGAEPEWLIQPEPHLRNIQVIKALNWYNRFYDLKAARDMLRDYLKSKKHEDQAAYIGRVPEHFFNRSVCWLSRMSLRGLTLNNQELEKLSEEVLRLLSLIQPQEKTEIKHRVNVQEIMREKAQNAAGEIEGLFDEFVKSGAKFTDDKLDVMRLLHEQNIMPQHVGFIIDHWRLRRVEFEAISDDSALAEGYKNFSKTQIRGLIKFCDAVITDLGGYVTVKKATKAPRKRKVVSPEKQASKLQYLKKHDELKLNSISPAKIIGATEVWAYDVEKRKLWYFIADQHAGSLSIKGTTILGFDSSASGMKVLRKPQEQLKEFMAAGKPASRKFFKELKSVHAQLKGRTNENLIILKVY